MRLNSPQLASRAADWRWERVDRPAFGNSSYAITASMNEEGVPYAYFGPQCNDDSVVGLEFLMQHSEFDAPDDEIITVEARFDGGEVVRKMLDSTLGASTMDLRIVNPTEPAAQSWVTFDVAGLDEILPLLECDIKED